MTRLSSSAQLLVRAGTQAARPTEADRQRLFEALQARLGDAVLPSAAGTLVAQGAARAAWVKVSALTLGLGLLAAGSVAVLRPTQRPSGASPVHAPIVSVPAMTSASAAPTLAAAEASNTPVALDLPKAATSARSTSGVRRPPERLAQEVALLARATTALRSGRAGAALAVLNEHQSQFPQGVLVEERRAARAQALCALGRRAEAQSELSRLAKTAPQSAQVARARQACGEGL